MFICINLANFVAEGSGEDQKFAIAKAQKESLNQKLFNSSGSIFDWIEYDRACAVLENVSEYEYFTDLAANCAMDEETISKTTEIEQSAMKELSHFYKKFASLSKDEQEKLTKNFAQRYQEIRRILQAMYNRLYQ